jgi:hypothetical protein
LSTVAAEVEQLRFGCQYAAAVKLLPGPLGAYSRAVQLAEAGIEVVRDATGEQAAQMRGGLHLLAGWAERALGHAAEGDALIATAVVIAEQAGESQGHDPLGLAFGPTNIGLWRISAATETGDPGRAIEIAQELSPGVLPVSRRTALYLDVGRALAAVGNDQRAVKMLLQAERLGPERVRRSPLVAESVRAMVHRQHRTDPPALTGLAERVGVAR